MNHCRKGSGPTQAQVHNIPKRLNKDVIRTCLLLLMFTSNVALASVVDRIVVVIERDLVMQSDVRFEEIVAGLDSASHPFWNRARATPTQRLVDAAVIRKLAGTVSLYEPEPARVLARLEKIRTRFGTQQAWADFLGFWGLDEVGFTRLLRRRMVVEKYVTRNLQSQADSAEAWQADFETFMEQVRNRYRIRFVPEASPDP